MKKMLTPLEPFLSRLTLFLSLILCLNSCHKTDIDLDSGKSDRLTEMKSDFTKMQETKRVAPTGQSFLADSLLSQRQLDWEGAIEGSGRDTGFVFVPVKLPQLLSVREGGKVGFVLNDNLWLRLHKVGGQLKSEMVVVIPDTSEEKGVFNGHMIVEDWFEPFRRFANVRGRSQLDRKDSVKLVTPMIIEPDINVVCINYSYEICAGPVKSDQNGIPVCVLYGGTTCVYMESSGGGVPPVEEGGGSGGGTVGGYTGNNFTTQMNRSLPRCNFNFGQTASNWRAAGVKDIIIGLVPDGPIRFSLEVGMPLRLDYYNRTISEAEAQEISAAAYIYAATEVNQMYSSGAISYAAVAREIAKAMTRAINLQLGTTYVATVSVVIKAGTPTTIANFNLDCD